MNTVYARKLTRDETIERVPPAHGYQLPVPPCCARKGDVAFYADRELTRFMGVHPGHYSGCPTRRHKTTMLNCMRVKIEWVDQEASNDTH